MIKPNCLPKHTAAIWYKVNAIYSLSQISFISMTCCFSNIFIFKIQNKNSTTYK